MWKSRNLTLAFASLIFSFGVISTNMTVIALSGRDFNAGRIIDDSVFFNPNLATANQIQTFLSSKVPTCDTNGTEIYSGSTTRATYGTSKGYPAPYTCLKDYVTTIPGISADGYCTKSVQSGTKSAAQIIYDVSQACNINPMVLIVTLQKEQTLITDDWPWATQYTKATGYGCPDAGLGTEVDANQNGCYDQYEGFFNQIYYSARQFQRYAKNSELFNFRSGATSYIQYHPNIACGGSNVMIQNQATAGLYNYTPYQPNVAALNNLYGVGDGCSAYGNRNFWRLFNDWFGSTYYQGTLIGFKSHVSNIGWGDTSINDGITGTVGKNLPMEAFKINGEVEYSSYNNDTGWQPAVNRGMISGTTGQQKSVQAIKINPIGTLSNQYDIWYRAHVSNIGWMDWTKNNGVAGVTGDSGKSLEAFEIRLAAKGSSAPGNTTIPYINNGVTKYTPPLSLIVSAHAANIGWQPEVVDGMATGTTEQSRRLEAIKASLINNTGLTGSIMYSGHIAGIGWQEIKKDGDISGTTGQQRQIEAFRIILTGDLGNNYDIWYRAHIATMGWTDWAKNGMPSGSAGAGLQLEALETRLVSKNTLSLPSKNSFYNPKGWSLPDNYSIIYSTHVSNIGWSGETTQSLVGGTTGQARPLEALRFLNTLSFNGPISIYCSAYVKGLGWTSVTSPTFTCGTTGQNKPIEGIKLSLSGSTASVYDIYYRVHLSELGWQDWTKGDTAAGMPNSGKSIEAVVVKLVLK